MVAHQLHPMAHLICSELHLIERTISVSSLVCPATILRTGNSELEKLWKVVEKRVKNHRNYKVARCVVEPGNVRTEISIFFIHILGHWYLYC